MINDAYFEYIFLILCWFTKLTITGMVKNIFLLLLGLISDEKFFDNLKMNCYAVSVYVDSFDVSQIILNEFNQYLYPVTKSDDEMKFEIEMLPEPDRGTENNKHCSLYVTKTKTNLTKFVENKLKLYDEFNFASILSNNQKSTFRKICLKSNIVFLKNYLEKCQKEINSWTDLKVRISYFPFLPYIGNK